MINEREITMEQLPQVGFMKIIRIILEKLCKFSRGDRSVVNIGIWHYGI